METRKLIQYIKHGKIYDLGMEYYVGMPHHPNHPPFAFSLTKLHGEVTYDGGVSASNCLFTTGGHTGTHFDALGHIAVNSSIYGVEDITPWQDYRGLQRGDISRVPPVVTRGVLLDIPALEGLSCLPSNYSIGSECLEKATTRQGLRIEQGDAVLVRTGWIQYYDTPVKYLSHNNGCPGVVSTGASFLVDQGVKYVGGDTIAFEKTPSANLEVHVILLVNNGIHIIEAMNLEELARDRIYEFLFFVSPLKIRGGTASPVRPIAMVSLD
jgi:kynurenine formamidase